MKQRKRRQETESGGEIEVLDETQFVSALLRFVLFVFIRVFVG